MGLEQTAKENAKLKARVAKLEQTAEENAELKARVAKLEQKQSQNIFLPIPVHPTPCPYHQKIRRSMIEV